MLCQGEIALSAKDRILAAAETLFAESGFDATPTSRIAEAAGVPKALVHYYFRRKPDLLAALVDRLPEHPVDLETVVVPGDVAASLRALVAELDAHHDDSTLLSHLLWREADTHPAVRDALHARFERTVGHAQEVIAAARPDAPATTVTAAATLLALAVGYRHSVARHHPDWPAAQADRLAAEVELIARAIGTLDPPVK
ncbi:TetR/AcrR family transcriptional regulator [Crossiella sp. S99.2]|nr:MULTISPECIES: TetR/AcrR family transcriptional regulator [unclassified Crossiella]MCK2244873.1 TetR/AcrR family transcriptional regulator [Crossiella sp. S99.2]MCK2258574.1 TetR/AcrR family transcriptional regulator [Crossiella sp. S99.1]